MATCPFCRRGLTPDHCRHHPGGSHYAHPASLQASLRPTPSRAGPLSPRNIRLGRLSPRRRTWSHKRRAHSGGVSHPFERLTSRLKSLPPSRPSTIALLGFRLRRIFPPPLSDNVLISGGLVQFLEPLCTRLILHCCFVFWFFSYFIDPWLSFSFP